MRAVWPLLALLLAGLSLVSAVVTKTPAADKDAAAAAAAEQPWRKLREPSHLHSHEDPSHLHPRDPHQDPFAHQHADKMPGKGPVMPGPVTGGVQDVTGSNDENLSDVSEFVADHLKEQNSDLTFVQVKAEVQVVAGLMYTLHYQGNDDAGVCKEERVIVVYDKPWANARVIKSEDVTECT